eukprot:SAG31_NODE_4525_length_3165_cov_1.986301_3_plen_151_part_00
MRQWSACPPSKACFTASWPLLRDLQVAQNDFDAASMNTGASAEAVESRYWAQNMDSDLSSAHHWSALGMCLCRWCRRHDWQCMSSRVGAPVCDVSRLDTGAVPAVLATLVAADSELDSVIGVASAGNLSGDWTHRSHSYPVRSGCESTDR